MNPATVYDLKKALSTLEPDELTELCLRMARYKKENKELLSFLLYMADDIPGFIKDIKTDIDQWFRELNRSNTYVTTKGLRKILRITGKWIKFSGDKQVEVELLIYYCKKHKEAGFAVNNSTAMQNIYLRQLEKIDKALSRLHEDLQADYRKDRQRLDV